MTTSKTYDIKVDNVGPLTTTFTGPSTCLQTTTLVGSAEYYVAAFWDDVSACYPPGTASPFNFHSLPQYYSPGICPSGWAPVTSAGADFPGTASGYSQWVIPSPTQVWLCCPSGYSYDGLSQTAFYYTQSCGSKLVRGQHMTSLKLSGSSNVAPTVTISSTVRVSAVGILIMWESTDTNVVEWAKKATITGSAVSAPTGSTGAVLTSNTDGDSSTNSVGTTPANTGTTSSSATNTSSLSNSQTQTSTPSPSGGGGLSTGAKAGIGVAVPLGVFALLFLGFWFGRRKLRKSQPQFSTSPRVQSGGTGDGGGQYPEMVTNANSREMYTRYNVHELPEDRRAMELPS